MYKLSVFIRQLKSAIDFRNISSEKTNPKDLGYFMVTYLLVCLRLYLLFIIINFKFGPMSLKELEDYHWFPSLFRKYQMEFIGILVSRFSLYDKVADMIKCDLAQNDIANIEDLCSGSGLPAIFVHRKINIPGLTTTLTDKYPQQIEMEKDICYQQEAVDIFNTEISSQKYYTMYNAFHHFESEDQKLLLQKVIKNQGNLLIVEIIQPTFLHFLQVTLASTLGVLFLCPLIRPFEWKRLFFTYIFPMNVLTVLIDGYISIIKSKSKRRYIEWIQTHFENKDAIIVEEHFRFPTYIIIIQVKGSHV